MKVELTAFWFQVMDKVIITVDDVPDAEFDGVQTAQAPLDRYPAPLSGFEDRMDLLLCISSSWRRDPARCFLQSLSVLVECP